MSSGGREEKGYVDSHVAMVGIGKPRGASKCIPVGNFIQLIVVLKAAPAYNRFTKHLEGQVTGVDLRLF